MKFYLFLLLFIFASFGFSNINLDIGINAGIEQNIYDAKEESFKAKFQYGAGFNPYFRFLFINLIGIEFGFPGFFYTFSSDTIGDYYYPEKIKIPYNIKLLAIIKYKRFNFEAGAGYCFPYYIIASYYAPRYLLSGLSMLGGFSYTLTERLFLGIRLEMAIYNDEYSSLNDSIYYMLNIFYRIL